VKIPDGVTSIRGSTFSGCDSLVSVTIPTSVDSIYGSAFANCGSLKTITIPDNVTFMASDVFSGSGLTSVTIPNSMSSIGRLTFRGCRNLTSVTIPNSVTLIAYGAFDSCSALTSVTIPSSVDSISGVAFMNCSSLKSVISLKTVPPVMVAGRYNDVDMENFLGVPMDSVCLYVPKASISAYRSANGWNIFSNVKSLEEVSVASNARIIPSNNAETAVVSPTVSLSGNFTAGANPAVRSSGAVVFYWQGKRIESGALTIYDASGNIVRKLSITDNAVAGNNSKRAVGSWDLRDGRGRQVSDGTYLVKGKVVAADGKVEAVAVVVGVR